MVSIGYEEIDHTADLALRVWGDDFKWILIHAAQGMYALMGVTHDLASPATISFMIEDVEKETMLVDFLGELLYLCEDKQKAFDEFAFEDQHGRIEVKASGYGISAVNRDIKAVTFHNLKITQTDSGLETTITFDV